MLLPRNQHISEAEYRGQDESEVQSQELIQGIDEIVEADRKKAELEMKFANAFYKYPAPFNGPPIMWEDDKLIGFQEYKIPEAYEKSGGYFPDIVQEYLYVTCAEKNIDYVIMVALYESESGYKYDIIGASGDSGYGQIIPSSNRKWIEELGIDDVTNPYQNILLSTTIIQYLVENYEGNYEKALTAYNAGMNGAYNKYFSQGINSSPYAQKILEKAERIRKEMQNAAEN